jgi:hypothetical protein
MLYLYLIIVSVFQAQGFCLKLRGSSGASNATVAISVFENSRQAREFGFECRCRRLVMMPSVVETTLRVSRKSDLVVLAK